MQGVAQVEHRKSAVAVMRKLPALPDIEHICKAREDDHLNQRKDSLATPTNSKSPSNNESARFGQLPGFNAECNRRSSQPEMFSSGFGPTLNLSDCESSETCKQFWTEQLQLYTPDGEHGVDGRDDDWRTLRMQSTVSSRRLIEVAGGSGYNSIASYFRTAWALVLGCVLEKNRVFLKEAITLPLENRPKSPTTIVPILVTCEGTVSETLKAQKAFFHLAWSHRDIDDETIRTFLDLSDELPLFDATFAFNPEQQDIPQCLAEETENKVDSPAPFFAFSIKRGCSSDFIMELKMPSSMMPAAQHQLMLRQIDSLLLAITQHPCVPASVEESLPQELVSVTNPDLDTCWPSMLQPTYWIEYWARTKPDWKGAEIISKIHSERVETVSWTFNELNAEANKIARVIVQHNISNRAIGMCLGRTLTAYAVQLGILKSGNAYLPLDEALPDDRKAFLLRDSNAAMVFATADVLNSSSLPEECQLVNPESDDTISMLASVDTSDIEDQGDLENNAYILYTSGSTGLPKGVLVSRKNLTNFVEAWSKFMYESVPRLDELQGSGKYLGLASRAFDPHIGEMFLAWRHGLAAVTADKSTLLDDLALTLKYLRITHASFVPSLLDQTGLTPQDTPDLVWLTVGGEKMSPKTKKIWGSDRRVALINAYGPTEATIGCCANRICSDSETNDVGKPLGDSIAHVLKLDSWDYAIRGAPGELCFTGSLVAKGYLNRPDAKGFTEDFRGQRLYRTGDIVTLLPNDHIKFLGRRDDQVKIRGQGVELGEVAEGVRTASSVSIDAVALVLKHPKLPSAQLVVFVSQSTGAANTAQLPVAIVDEQIHEANDLLRQQCRKSLPVFMVPDIILPLNRIPLAPTSGKTDKKRLTQLFNAASLNVIQGTRKRDSVEKKAIDRAMTEAEGFVYSIVSESLDAIPPNVSYRSRILQLGVDSLSAVGLYKRLREAGLECNLIMILSNPSIEELAKIQVQATTVRETLNQDFQKSIAQLRSAYVGSLDNSEAANAVAVVRPCFPLQEIMVAQSLHQDSGDGDFAYVHHMTFELGGSVDIDVLNRAWQTVVSANEILRTHFTASSAGYVQVTLKSYDRILNPLTFATEQRSDFEDLQRKISEDMIGSLLTTPPLRISTISTEHGRKSLMISIHHALFDGTSFDMILQDLKSCYHGHPLTVRPSITSLLEHIATQDMNRSKQFWTSLLKDWEHTPLLSKEAIRHKAPIKIQRTFSKSLREFDRYVSSFGCTLSTFLQCTFGICMARIVRTSDIVLGSVLSGRTVPVPEADRMMAPCITTIPYRIKLENAEQTISELFASSQKQFSASLEFQHTSPRQIQAWTNADRPLYDCLFSFIRGGMLDAGAWTLLNPVAYDFAVDYPLAIEVQANDSKHELVVCAGFVETSFPKNEAEILLEKMELLANIFVQQKDLPVGDLGLSNLTYSDRQIQDLDEMSWTPLDDRLRDLVSQFVSVPQMNIKKNTSFVQLGIDSLVAVRFGKYLRSNGIEVSSADIVRHNRLGHLSGFLSSDRRSLDPGLDTPVSKDHPDLVFEILEAQSVLSKDDTDLQCYECTPLQAGMLSQSLATDGSLYLHHHAIQLSADIELEQLNQAWLYLVSELDILRTTFHWIPQHKTPWLAVVWPKVTVPWIEVETPNVQTYWQTLPQTIKFASFIDEAKPLVCVTIVNPKTRPVAIFTLHHCLYDGISIDMLWERLWTRYSGTEATTLMPFYEAARAITKNHQSSVDFWTKHVLGYNPQISMRVEDQHEWAVIKSTVTTNVACLTDKCVQNDMDIKDVCIVAFGKALACLLGCRDVVFGHVTAARSALSNEKLDVVGPMFNTVPLRVTLADRLSSNADLVRGIRKVNRDSIGRQHAPLAEVQKAWRAQPPHSNASLIESILVYSKKSWAQENDVSRLGKPIQPDNVSVASEYHLNCEVEHTEDMILMSCSSSLSPEKVKCLLDDFRDALFDIVEKPSRFAIAHPGKLQTLPTIVPRATVIPMSFDQKALDLYGETIRSAIAQVIGVSVEKMTAESSLHSFGVDSIMAIRIASLCRGNGLRINALDLMQGATLGKICEIAALKTSEESKTSRDRAMISIPDADREAIVSILGNRDDLIQDVLPCLPGQLHYIMHWLNSGRTLHEPGWTFKSTIKLEANRLRRSWRSLRKDHPILRTTFVAIDARKVYQVVAKVEALDDALFLVVEDSRSLLDILRERASVEAYSPSDLFTPPLRLRLIKAADGDAIMLYSHHGLYDAWTMPRLISELSTIYQEGRTEPSTQFAEFVQQSHVSLDAAVEQDYWRDALAGCKPTLLSCCKTQHDASDRKQNFRLHETKSIFVAEMERACSTSGFSAHHIILLSFSRALARYTGNASPLFGLYQLGRSGATADEVDGPCVNNLPFGLPNVLEEDTLQCLCKIKTLLTKRVAFEQSNPDTAVASLDFDSQCLPYNAHLNVLWQKDSLAGTAYADQALFMPYDLGQATDYSSDRKIEGRTAMDALDMTRMPKHNVFADIEPGEDGVLIGVMADEVLMDDAAVLEFSDKIEQEIVGCVADLKAFSTSRSSKTTYG